MPRMACQQCLSPISIVSCSSWRSGAMVASVEFWGDFDFEALPGRPWSPPKGSRWGLVAENP